MSAPNKTTFALAAVIAATVGTAALAEMGPDEHGGPGPKLLEMFASIDTDADGKVTLEELAAHRAAMFTTADANADGVLNAEEVAAHHEAQMQAMIAERSARMIERHDDNGDGSLSAEEMGEGPLEDRFALLDADNDGAISQAEAEAAAEHRGHRKHGQKGGWMGGWFN